MLSSNVGKVKLSRCFLNASGPRTISIQQLIELDSNSDGSLGGIVTKTYTLFPQPPTPQPNVYFDLCGSINRIGLENKGLPHFLNSLNSTSHRFDRPLIISIADPHNNIENIKVMLEYLINVECSIEINLSCPNVNFFEKSSFYDLVYEVVVILGEIMVNMNVGIKVPYLHSHEITAISNLLNEMKVINFVVCINTIPGLLVDPIQECCVINSTNGGIGGVGGVGGIGGIGGEYLKPFGLKCVREFYTQLDRSINIVGCGGISTPEDAFEYLLCGASAIQIGTKFFKSGKLEHISNGLETIMKRKKYARITQFQGKLREI